MFNKVKGFLGTKTEITHGARIGIVGCSLVLYGCVLGACKMAENANLDAFNERLKNANLDLENRVLKTENKGLKEQLNYNDDESFVG